MEITATDFLDCMPLSLSDTKFCLETSQRYGKVADGSARGSKGRWGRAEAFLKFVLSCMKDPLLIIGPQGCFAEYLRTLHAQNLERTGGLH